MAIRISIRVGWEIRLRKLAKLNNDSYNKLPKSQTKVQKAESHSGAVGHHLQDSIPRHQEAVMRAYPILGLLLPIVFRIGKRFMFWSIKTMLEN